ncbi:MAG: hypothetical protein QM674_20590 [Burkholderiaceae bacterium]
MTEAASLAENPPEPIRMVLYCPRCLFQHIDAPDETTGWTNPPHLSHRCAKCKLVWRPADVPTRGVMLLETRGPRDADPLTIAVAQAAREKQVTDASGLTPVERAVQTKIDAVQTQLDAARDEAEQARAICQQGYQVVRRMAEEMDVLDTPPVKEALANLSAARAIHPNVLPFKCDNARALRIAATARTETAQISRQLQGDRTRATAGLAHPGQWIGSLGPQMPTITPRLLTRGLLLLLIGFICMLITSALFSFWERVAGL